MCHVPRITIAGHISANPGLSAQKIMHLPIQVLHVWTVGYTWVREKSTKQNNNQNSSWKMQQIEPNASCKQQCKRGTAVLHIILHIHAIASTDWKVDAATLLCLFAAHNYRFVSDAYDANNLSA